MDNNILTALYDRLIKRYTNRLVRCDKVILKNGNITDLYTDQERSEMIMQIKILKERRNNLMRNKTEGK